MLHPSLHQLGSCNLLATLSCMHVIYRTMPTCTHALHCTRMSAPSAGLLTSFQLTASAQYCRHTPAALISVPCIQLSSSHTHKHDKHHLLTPHADSVPVCCTHTPLTPTPPATHTRIHTIAPHPTSTTTDYDAYGLEAADNLSPPQHTLLILAACWCARQGLVLQRC